MNVSTAQDFHKHVYTRYTSQTETLGTSVRRIQFDSVTLGDCFKSSRRARCRQRRARRHDVEGSAGAVEASSMAERSAASRAQRAQDAGAPVGPPQRQRREPAIKAPCSNRPEKSSESPETHHLDQIWTFFASHATGLARAGRYQRSARGRFAWQGSPAPPSSRPAPNHRLTSGHTHPTQPLRASLQNPRHILCTTRARDQPVCARKAALAAP